MKIGIGIGIDIQPEPNPSLGKTWENEKYFIWESWDGQVWEDQL